ncbi:peptidoglycan-binding protein [Arthrobacter sp. MYb227]|uniref:LysM peptidoglycan-binding domain-containing protein n=1 Tax=Arthrobacter sp. MYb227 TaxID=1848601 RepID=UPI000CFAAACC|nr:LysM peptidoglycan-binding domain-containing protein [Arthrobacter sp. MYb227]PQZ92830.1 peptidoglycan-binding protein [Arthrobacter sp. MYb227]
MANTAFSAPLHLVPEPAATTTRSDLAPLRLTRRGKFVLIGMPIFILSVGVLMLIGVFLSPAKASADAPLGVDALNVTVVEGDTLWGLAREFAPNTERREAIRQIAELNNLHGNILHAGTELFIPRDN